MSINISEKFKIRKHSGEKKIHRAHLFFLPVFGSLETSWIFNFFQNCNFETPLRNRQNTARIFSHHVNLSKNKIATSHFITQSSFTCFFFKKNKNCLNHLLAWQYHSRSYSLAISFSIKFKFNCKNNYEREWAAPNSFIHSHLIGPTRQEKNNSTFVFIQCSFEIFRKNCQFCYYTDAICNKNKTTNSFSFDHQITSRKTEKHKIISKTPENILGNNSKN